MLKVIRINNIALISEAVLEFGPGLTLLTGETGAGKSILVDALGLLLGDRAHADLIRSGEQQAVVEAIFVPADAAALLEPHGLPHYGDEVVVRREVQPPSRGRASVNGALVPVGLLRELAPRLAAIHGQHDQQGLLDPGTHLSVLDRHAGLIARVEEVGARFAALREVEQRLERLRSDRREQERRRESLEFQACEIEKAGLRDGEEEELRREKGLQAHAGRLKTLAAENYGLLYEDEESVLDRLGQVFKRLEELARLDPAWERFVRSRSEIVGPLEDLSLSLRDYGDQLEASPERLDEIETRLALIERLKRKYGDSVQEVLAFAESCRAELGGAASLEEQEHALEQQQASLASRYLEVATELSKRRRSSAGAFEKRVLAELRPLAMERARFEVGFTPERITSEPDPAGWTEAGLESAEFLLSANPGEELKPLARVASGGELSRILLALKSVASLDALGLTLVFDEVDTGIGGAVAEAVGRKLRSMASRHQVLCVTHLPQIASLADRHYVVRKRVDGGRTRTSVVALEADDRVDEVARMLGGESITEAARQHAREMVRQGVR
jgi:DNA repair protein RecN (Recombination protein N)